MDGYGPLRAPELRWLCSQRGLSPYGLKQDLIARLDEQDQQGVVSSSECFSPGLEPFRELEELAQKLAANPRVAATPKTPAKAKTSGPMLAPMAPMAPMAPKAPVMAPTSLPVVPARLAPISPTLPVPAGEVPSSPSMPSMGVAPAQAKMPPQPGPGQQGLTKDERALRGLLEFFACSDVKNSGGTNLFACKYRDFVRTVFDVLQFDLEDANTAGSLEATAATAAAATAAAAAVTTDAILRGNVEEVVEEGQGESNETWSSEMWQKCKDVIDTHLQVCLLQMKHNALFAELEQMSKAAALKAEEIKEVKGRLDQLVESEAMQRSQLLDRARLQLGAWLNKAETAPP